MVLDFDLDYISQLKDKSTVLGYEPLGFGVPRTDGELYFGDEDHLLAFGSSLDWNLNTLVADWKDYGENSPAPGDPYDRIGSMT